MELTAMIPGPALDLSRLIVGPDEGWLPDMYAIFSRLSDAALELVVAETAEFNKNHWETLGLILNDYIFKYPSPLELKKGDLPEDEFVIRAAVKLIPVVVHFHLPMLGTTTTSWDGSQHENDEYDMQEAACSAILSQLSSTPHSEDQLSILIGTYLLTDFCGEEEFSPEDIQWVSEHALALLPYYDRVFGESFNRRLAEELVRVETPVMRDGVL